MHTEAYGWNWIWNERVPVLLGLLWSRERLWWLKTLQLTFGNSCHFGFLHWMDTDLEVSWGQETLPFYCCVQCPELCLVQKRQLQNEWMMPFDQRWIPTSHRFLILEERTFLQERYVIGMKKDASHPSQLLHSSQLLPFPTSTPFPCIFQCEWIPL